MAKAKETQSSFIPQRPFFANCAVIGCRRGYTAMTRETAGHHCICGAKIAWNNMQSRERPTFTSYKELR